MNTYSVEIKKSGEPVGTETTQAPDALTATNQVSGAGATSNMEFTAKLISGEHAITPEIITLTVPKKAAYQVIKDLEVTLWVLAEDRDSFHVSVSNPRDRAILEKITREFKSY